MYDHRMTKPQAMAAARYLIVTFHEELPDVDGTTEAVIIDQFIRELSAQVQHDMDVDYVIDILNTLDRASDLYWRTGEYVRIDNDAFVVENEHISNALASDLEQLFSNYSPRAVHYFPTAA